MMRWEEREKLPSVEMFILVTSDFLFLSPTEEIVGENRVN